jgi:hypothetical protein
VNAIDTELFAHRSRITNRFTAAVDLHHARASHVLGQMFIGRPDGGFDHREHPLTNANNCTVRPVDAASGRAFYAVNRRKP